MESTFAKDWENLIESFHSVKKTGKNPHFNSKHVELKELLPMVKENCKKHGFIFFQCPEIFDGKSCLSTVFEHVSSKEKVRGTLELVHKPEDPQKLGGSITYMRRYMLTCMLGIEEDDDDGNMASGLGKPVQKKQVSSIDEL